MIMMWMMSASRFSRHSVRALGKDDGVRDGCWGQESYGHGIAVSGGVGGSAFGFSLASRSTRRKRAQTATHGTHSTDFLYLEQDTVLTPRHGLRCNTGTSLNKQTTCCKSIEALSGRVWPGSWIYNVFRTLQSKMNESSQPYVLHHPDLRDLGQPWRNICTAPDLTGPTEMCFQERESTLSMSDSQWRRNDDGLVEEQWLLGTTAGSTSAASRAHSSRGRC